MAFLHDLETNLIEQEIIYLYENGVYVNDIPKYLGENFQYNFSISTIEHLLVITIEDVDDIDFIEIDTNKLNRLSRDINAEDFMPVKFDDPNDSDLIAEKTRLEKLKREEFNMVKGLYS